jgi:hypothetical protein
VTKHNDTGLSFCNRNDGVPNKRPRTHWRASLVPAAAVIPAPIAYIEVVAVKKFVVGGKRAGTRGGPSSEGPPTCTGWRGAKHGSRPRAGHRCASYFEENRVFKAGDRLYMLAWNSTVPLAAAGWSRWNG